MKNRSNEILKQATEKYNSQLIGMVRAVERREERKERRQQAIERVNRLRARHNMKPLTINKEEE